MSKDYFVGFWNLENLFAPEGFPDRLEWLEKRIRSDLKDWTEALFKRKISQLATVIASMNAGAGPDILGVCEVENRFVLDVLVEELAGRLPGRRFDVVHANAERDHRGIDTAFLYDTKSFSVRKREIFSHFVMRRTGTRDITQVTFVSKARNELVAIANHWPSRTTGTAETQGFRATAGETLAYWHERIREVKGPDVPIIALGDFNDDPFDGSMAFNALATRERGDVQRARSAKFYNLSWRYLQTVAKSSNDRNRILDGTLYYRNNGNIFDQILVSKGLLMARKSPFTVLEETAGIVAYPPMISTKTGEGPIRFGLPKGNTTKNINRDGFSDHFPVAVVIREKTE